MLLDKVCVMKNNPKSHFALPNNSDETLFPQSQSAETRTTAWMHETEGRIKHRMCQFKVVHYK